MTHEWWLSAAECAECRFVLEYKYPNDPENLVLHLQAQKDALYAAAVAAFGPEPIKAIIEVMEAKK